MAAIRPTTRARLVCDEATARRVADRLADGFEVAVAAFEGTDGRWNVEAFFADAPNQAEVRRCVEPAADARIVAALAFDQVEAQDWIAASLAGLKPVVAGRFTVHGAHDRVRVPSNRVGIEIEAALAFGTGHHGTTRGCLLALDGLVKRLKTATPTLPRKPRREMRILDIGTGTGVLAIAAAKSLRRPVLASDIDTEAVTIARDNARLNGVGPFVTCLHAAGLTDQRIHIGAPFDLVFANILLPPLQRLAAPLARLAAPGAVVILSGLLATQENAARAAYRAHGFMFQRRIPLDEWVTLVLKRPAFTGRGGACATARE
jgi:ribosomal protein L11 methyltransferase